MSTAVARVPHERCGARTRGKSTCKQAAGARTPHLGQGRCWLHGGMTPIKHGRYSTIQRDEIRALIEKHEADPDPLNILPELAATRALFQDFVDRYDAWRDAIIAWHRSFSSSARPITEDRLLALKALLDEYEALLEADATDRQEADLALTRETLQLLSAPLEEKPHHVLDIADAYRIVSEITKIVERIERIRSENAISRPDLLRIMGEMGRTVDTFVTDPQLQQQIKEAWLAIRV